MMAERTLNLWDEVEVCSRMVICGEGKGEREMGRGFEE
jgi:hypothetical protein